MEYEDADRMPEVGDTGLIDFASVLNAEQYEAVTAPFGPALVLAGAGSGKTRTLTYRVAWLLSQGVKPSDILLLTFTNKAAREMLGRVEELTGVPARYFWGGTFHHIGQRFIRLFGTSVGIGKNFNIIDSDDAESLLGQVIQDTDREFLKHKDNPKTRVVMSIVSYARNTCRPVGEVISDKYDYFEEVSGQIQQFAKLYQAKKLEQQVADYDDLLEYWLKILESDEQAAYYASQRFTQILVDEYQDTNMLQSRIIDRIGTHHRIMAVGDDAQCIYTWRGADFDNIMTFPDRHPGTRIFKIETNYRSTPEILRFANRVLDCQPEGIGFRKELKAFRAANIHPYFIQAIDTRQQAQFVAQRIDYLVENRGMSYRDIAVLYRAHYQAMDLQVELSKRRVPYQITSGVRFFEQAHIRDLVAQVRFAVNPEDSTAFQRFTCLLPKMGPKTALKILELAKDLSHKQKKSVLDVLNQDAILKKVPELGREEWPSLVQTLRDIASNAASEPKQPEAAVKIAVEGWYGDYIREAYENWMQRKDDLESLIGFAARFDSMAEMLAQLVLLNSETSDRSIERSEDCVRLTTVHQAKGLEFPAVFVIGLADGQFPIKRAVEEGNVEEERRLFYVAVTRAMDELYMVFPIISVQAGPMTRSEPSRFIREVPPTCFETVAMHQHRY